MYSKDPTLKMEDKGVFDDIPDILQTWNRVEKYQGDHQKSPLGD